MNHIPQRILFAIIATLEAATRATLDLDVHTQRDTSGMGWLAFAHTDHGNGNHEVWGAWACMWWCPPLKQPVKAAQRGA